MTQSAILGVLGTHWERTRPRGVDTYLESIKRSGFSGRKIMLCYDIHPETRQALVKYGHELVDVPVPSEAFFHARVRIVYEYLKEHHKEFGWIHWLDVKDLLLQSNPDIWLLHNAAHHSLIGSSESVPICKEETNWLWANEILGAARAAEIADFSVFNGGAFSGKAELMAEFFYQVHLLCRAYTGQYPPCQLSMAYVANTIFKNDFYQPKLSEGYAVCPHPLWSPWRMPCWPHMRDPHPVLDINTCNLHAGTIPNPENSCLVFNPIWGNNPLVHIADRKIQIETPSHPLKGVELVDKPTGKIFSILHGFDRDWDMKSLYEFKYSAAVGDVTLEDFLKFNEDAAKSFAEIKRALRRPEGRWTGRQR
jgi:hypothetical protein